MVGWHHRINRHDFEHGPGDSEGQRSLERCSPWGCKESDMTEQLNNSLHPQRAHILDKEGWNLCIIRRTK